MKLKKCGNCYFYFGNGANNDGPSGTCVKAIPKCLVHFINDRGSACDIKLVQMMETRAADESHCICWKEV